MTRKKLYDGKGKWEDYLVKFELIAVINKWSDKKESFRLLQIKEALP